VIVKPDEAIVNNYTSGANTYSIPVFQRPYEWDAEKWFYLWQDIRSLYKVAEFNMSQDSSLDSRSALKDKTHFIGTILTRATENLSDGLGNKFTLIDGQQRFVTLFILLSAIRDESYGLGEPVPAENFLSVVRGDKETLDRFQVNRADALAFKRIVTGLCKNGLNKLDYSSRLGQAYLFFRWQLKLGSEPQIESEVDVKSFLPPKASRKKDAPDPGDFHSYWPKKSISKDYNLELLKNCIGYGLTILDIKLEPTDEDDAIIFETINAKSTPLEKFDLIRNSFFLRLGSSKTIFFDEEWPEFQKRLDKLSVKPDQFVYDYLQFLGIPKVSKPRLYTLWKDHVTGVIGRLGGDETGSYFAEYVARPMIKTSLIYPLSRGESASINTEDFQVKLPSEVANLIQEVIAVSKDPVVPLHMLAIDAWLSKKMSDADLKTWIKKVQGLVLRQVLSGEDLQNLRASVLQAAPELSKSVNLETLDRVLVGKLRQPSDSQLRNAIGHVSCAKDENSAAILSILRGAERQLRKESAHSIPQGTLASLWQVEHIYPQSSKSPGEVWLSDMKKWKIEREHYDQLKHTLGNVTALTSKANQQAGQKSFSDKKQKFKESHLGINDDLLDKEHWTPKDILARSSVLLSLFIDEWPDCPRS
jgi:Protein of unknown function DUF262/Protein of unknown function (DUF1524)